MAGVETLPFQLAIRSVVDEIWYSNALPEWYTPELIDDAARVVRLRERAGRYLKGESPLPVLQLQVPRLNSGARTWSVPAVNDQMIMHACVANLVTEVAKNFDRKRVFSHAPNDDPNRVAFMNPQIAALLAFHKETVGRLQQGTFVLEFDIERAFASIDRDKFFKFLEGLKPKGVEVTLIRQLMSAWSGTEPGIPLVNDSVFFLGGAYLSVVDREVSRITKNYIRYVDDYRVFGGSQAELERTYEKISGRLSQLSLKMNPRKVRIGSSKDFLQPISEPKFVTPAATAYVIDLDVGMKSQLVPELLASLVSRSLEHPSEYLNEGVGRYVLGALRRYRLNRAIYRRAKEEAELGNKLKKALVEDSKVVQLTESRLAEYGKDPQNSWRAIWVIYLIEQQGTAKKYESSLSQIEESAQMPDVVKLWARRCRLGIGGEPQRLDDDLLHEMGYLDAGQRCYGEQPCKGEGF